MHVDTLSCQEDYTYRNLFKILRVRFQHERFDGTLSPEVERCVFERGNSVGVLLYDAEEEVVFLTKQFRYPTYLHHGPGWLIEIVAGMQDKGRDAITVAHSELFEEIGYQVAELLPLCTCYLSPGASSEQITLYLAELCHAERAGQGGGLDTEHEDIQLLRLRLSEALSMIQQGEICDAKTIIALQQLYLLQREHMGGAVRQL
ncbi:NUDIX hydrolase [candidate division KSB3 bacterium]|uniref:NUDIX hydrolase n=1 Tax=candidate division KSB3 bacterium TaxID=2044937 RepID=A0A2G6KDZ5_9BACT|nr:MAG: NUDIX hydrolase [candidate division KSB3 bacterium]